MVILSLPQIAVWKFLGLKPEFYPFTMKYFDIKVGKLGKKSVLNNRTVLRNSSGDLQGRVKWLGLRLRESARTLEVTPLKKPRNPYQNRKKPAGTEKPYRDFDRYLALYWDFLRRSLWVAPSSESGFHPDFSENLSLGKKPWLEFWQITLNLANFLSLGCLEFSETHIKTLLNPIETAEKMPWF